MNNRLRRLQVFMLTICLITVFAQTVSAAKPINFEDALEQVFQDSKNYDLLRREHELAQKQHGLNKQPKLNFTATPIENKNGDWQKPQGILSLDMPLSEGLDLSGALAFEANKAGVQTKPTASLALNYSLFSVNEKNTPNWEKDLLTKENDLVLQTLTLLINLREKLDQQLLEQAKFELIERKLEAAQSTPGFDAADLNKEYNAQDTLLKQIAADLAEIQRQMATFLGADFAINYEPQLQIQDLELVFNLEEYENELFEFSSEWQQTQASLETAQEKLQKHKLSLGWDVTAAGDVSLDEWKVGLYVSKDLYPQRIIREELELNVDKSEQEYAARKLSLQNDLRTAIQSIESTRSRLEVQQELLADANEELNLAERKFTAGLITEIQLLETKLALQRAYQEYDHSKLAYGQNILVLWSLVGRNLRTVSAEVVK